MHKNYIDIIIDDIDFQCPYYDCNCYEAHCPFKNSCELDVDTLVLYIHCHHPIQLVIPFFNN